jgi:hypothetical protein
MNPEDRALLEHSIKLSEDNNKILQKMMRAQRRATVYGFVKLLIIIVPLVLGYVFLQPYIGEAQKNYSNIQDLLSR